MPAALQKPLSSSRPEMVAAHVPLALVYSRVSPDPPGANPLNLHQIEPGFLL